MIAGLFRNFYPKLSSGLHNHSNIQCKDILKRAKSVMDSNCKRELDSADIQIEEPLAKCLKSEQTPTVVNPISLKHGKGRLVPAAVLKKLSSDDVRLLENVKTSCTDLEKISSAVQLRIKHRLSIRLPEDYEDSTYYIENGLRHVYPYPYLYQSYAKRRWLGRRLNDVLREEFRDISIEQLKHRCEMKRVLVNGNPINFNYVLKDNDFVTNRNHRHELPVLATPIKIIYKDKDTLVVNKPPSMPIHPCGRYRHNSVLNILKKEYNYEDLKIVHRLDRLVSGVLIIAFNSNRANILETAIKNREVQKEYVCRVEGVFPLGEESEDGEITVDQPLEVIPGKIGITVVLPEGKESVTKFKRLNYNGKTSAVLCKPKTGRMHQIRVHLQYLGHPIVNDGLYNCDSFGLERGKGGRYGKSLRQLSNDVISKHRASVWLISETSDLIDIGQQEPLDDKEFKLEQDEKTIQFISDNERAETMDALRHFFTNESWLDLEQKWKFDAEKLVKDPDCFDCRHRFHEPPPRSLFLYLHALKYSGPDWSYESELPSWALDSWKY